VDENKIAEKSFKSKRVETLGDFLFESLSKTHITRAVRNTCLMCGSGIPPGQSFCGDPGEVCPDYSIFKKQKEMK